MISNTPGSVEAVRRYLKTLQQDEVTLSIARDTFRYGPWLLRLTDNDPTDLELVAKTLEHGRHYTELLKLLRSHEEGLSEAAQSTAMRALFWLDHHEPFTERWLEASTTVRGDPVMKLYSLAATAIQKRDEAAYKVFQIRSTEADPYSPEFLPAQRLAIRVHAALGNRKGCARVLEDLKKRRLATFQDYLPYWQLLAGQERTNEVLQALREAPDPVSTFEAYSLVKLLHEADRTGEALRVSRDLMEHFGNPLSLWLDHGNLLMETKRWPELKSLAMNVNQSDKLTHLWSTAKYWEGMAELFLDESEMAEERFMEIATYPIISVATSWEMIHRLRGLGQTAAAWSVLNQLEEVLGGDPAYWIRRCQMAAADKDLEALAESANKAYERAPESLVNINNLAVTLLLERKDPERALSLGRKLVEAEGDSVIYRLTLIHALILNDRLEEAEAQILGLEGVNVPTADLFADYRLAVFELAVAQGRLEEAATVREGLEMSFYMPEKAAWIQQALAGAPARTDQDAPNDPQG